MQKQTKSAELNHRLAGMKQEYWTLKLIRDGSIVGVHTSKNQSYITQRKVEWLRK
jgi:hypothetical protein